MAEEEKRPAKAKVQPAVEASKTEEGLSALSEMQIQSLDKPTHRKIAKGRVDIEARIDLHGLTQGEAHGLLYGFLGQRTCTWPASRHGYYRQKAVPYSAAKGFCDRRCRTGFPHRCSGFW